MFSTAARIITQQIVDDRKLKLPPIKNINSLEQHLYQLVCRYITTCVFADYNEWATTEEYPDPITKEQNYIEKRVLSRNYSDILFSKFPVLKKITYDLVCNYFSYSNLIFDFFMDDYARISSVWERDVGQIEEIIIGKGDTHSGASVAIIKTDNAKLVFKPRSLFSDEFFYKVMSALGENLSQSVFAPKMLSYDTHSWQEFIPYKECSSDEEAARFFYNAGISQFAFYMLSSVDMHYENLICYGEYPVFVDLETLISGSVSTLEHCEPKSLNTSVLMTGMLPGLKGTQNIIDMNLSALFTGHDKSEKHHITSIIRDSDGVWKEITVPVITTPTQNVVKVNGKEVEPHAYEKMFIKGFSDASQVFLDQKDRFLRIVDELSARSIKMRKILRPTIVYGKFIAASLRPEVLRSEQNYVAVFDILRKNFTIGAFGYLRVNYEIEELQKGNVPSFDIYSNSKNLYASGEMLCENYLCETPHASVRRRCLEITRELVEYQIRLIKMAFASQDKADDLTYPICRSSQENNPIKYVHICADMIEKSLIPAPSGGYAMIMLQTNVDNESFVVHTSDSELYHFGGIIWFLYAYGKKYDRKYCDYAIGLLSLLFSKYEFDSQSKTAKNYSVYSGYGSLAYLAFCIFKDSGENQLLNQCLKVLTDGFKQINSSGIKYDYVGGDLSFISLACKIAADQPKIKQELFDSIIKAKNTMKNDEWVLRNCGLAHGTAGLLTTLSLINSITGDCADEVFNLKRIVESAYADCSSYAWCKGKAGMALALHYAKAPKDSNELANMKVYNADAEKNLCLCHGLFGEFDVALSLFPERRSEIKKIINTFDFDTLRVFRNSDYLYESFMLGVSGIAYTILRSEYPDLPSLLSLEF